jgi:hypothetical protein
MTDRVGEHAGEEPGLLVATVLLSLRMRADQAPVTINVE